MERSQASGPRRVSAGVEALHSRACASRAGHSCDCLPSYRAFVYDRRSHKKIRRTFSTLAAAAAWRDETRILQREALLGIPARPRFRDGVEEWLAGVRSEPPTVVSRSGLPYRPSAVRGYESHLRRYVLDDLGSLELSGIRRRDIERLVARLRRRCLSPLSVRNVVNAVRVIFRHAVERGYVDANPIAWMRLEGGGDPRGRVASPEEAGELLAALPADLRALYAGAFYAGLRRGELRAMRWEDADVAGGVITVRRGWDDVAGEIAPTRTNGVRTVPVIALLRDYLVELRERSGRDERDFVFGASADRPFSPSRVGRNAARAWSDENTARAGRGEKPLVPIGLHDCRHTFVFLMYDAGLSLERIGGYVGHSPAYMIDRYRHLLDGAEAEMRRIMDDYLARADSREEADAERRSDVSD